MFSDCCKFIMLFLTDFLNGGIEIATDINGDIKQPDESFEGAAEVVDGWYPRKPMLQSLLHLPGWCFVGICFSMLFSVVYKIYLRVNTSHCFIVL